jgi:hypothetical protein
VAAAALAAVLSGTAFLYVAGRRAGRAAAAREVRRSAAADKTGEASAAVAALAQRIVDLDAKPLKKPAERKYRRLAADYADLVREVGTAGPDGLITRVEALGRRCDDLERA